MQKKILALAVAGLMSGAAFAQTNVEIYGNLDIGYLSGDQNTNTVNGAGVATKSDVDLTSTGFNNGALSTNLIGFRGTEDLGGGLKAHFQLEMGLNENGYLGADSGTEANADGAFAFRQQNLGLSGSFGRVTIGRQAVLIDSAWGVGSAGMKNNAVGDMYTSATGTAGLQVNTGGFHDVRANELITYVSPNFSGFTVAVQYGKGETDTSATANTDRAEHTNWGLRGDYAHGPLALVAAYNSEKNTDTDTTNATGIPLATSAKNDKDSWLIGGNYNFGVVKVFGQYFDGERNTDSWAGVTVAPSKVNADIDGWEFGVHVPVTAKVTLMGSYFKTDTDIKRTTNLGVESTDKVKGKGYQLAALYSLSKRSTAYIMYGDEKSRLNTNNSVASNNIDAYNFAIGLRHSF